jgi:RHS repeat-associated protein
MRVSGRAGRRSLGAVAVTLGLVLSTAVVGLGGSGGRAGGPAGPAGLLDRLSGLRRWQPGGDPQAAPVAPARSAARLADERWRGAAAPVRLPGPGHSTVGLTRQPRRAGDSPVSIAAGAPTAEGRTVAIEILDRAAAERAGAAAFVFTVAAEGGAGAGSLPVGLAVDYSGFAEMFGAGFAGRLRLVALPSCALAEPAVAGCPSGGVALRGRNDTAARKLTVSVTDLAEFGADRLNGLRLSPSDSTGGGGPVILAVTAGTGGELEGDGDFKATPFEMSSDWQVGVGSGEFSWKYNIPVPAPPAGAAPSLSVDYSSGSVDGLTSTRNTQASQSGVGWADFANAFVERRYTPCIEEVDEYPAIGDLCWKSDNAMLSLNGRSSDLIRIPNSSPRQWRLKRDPRWRVEQLTASLANGDNDREYWRVTTPDGTQYFFGLGVKPESSNAATNSVYTVPVMANHDGEPCRGNATGNFTENFCMQGWRWNLDRVVDPNGNVTTYQYSRSINYYKVALGLWGWQSYTRSGRLRLVEYGGNTGAFNGGTPVPAQVRIDVGGAHRCQTLDPDGGCVAPSAPTPGTTPETTYPDVPIDQICTSPSGTGCGNLVSPAFFTSVRYTKLTMQVLVGGAWKSVDAVTLTHRFEAENADGTGAKKLYLTGLQRTGLSGATPITLPGVTFGLTRLANRVRDAGSTLSTMPHLRVSTVVDEFGRKVTVSYGQPHPCTSTDPPPGGWDNNQRNCFRQQYLPEGATDPNWGVFNKYLVTAVKVEDTTGGSPAMTTTYTYGAQAGDATGDPYPAWHYDADAFYKDGDLQWTEWRGYDTVTVTQGSATTRTRVHRGMHRDRTGTGGERTVDIRTLDGTLTVRDLDWLTGRPLDEAKLAGDGSVLQGTVHEYLSVATVDDDTNGTNEPHPFKAAVWSGEKTTTTRTKRDGGGFVQNRTSVGYNGLLLFPETRYEEGRLDVSGDERCTLTGYVFDVNRWMLDFPSSSKLLQGNCSSTTVLTESQTAYDGGAVGAAPSRGNPSNARVRVSGTTWAETRTTRDALGRPRVVTDPNAHNSTTTYAPATGYPTRTDVTNHLGHTTTTNWVVERQLPATTVDARGKVTTYAYDALGRSVRVWRPTEPTSGPPSWEFSYGISPDRSAPPTIRTRQLQALTPSTVYIDSWMVYDSLLRERQDQRLSPVAGKVIVTDTRYNDRGLVEAKTLPQALAGTPGTRLAPPAGTPWDNENTTAHDELGRPFWEIFWTKGTYRWSTTKSYGHDTTTTLPHPTGGETVTTSDAYGNVTAVAEWATRGDPASAKTTRYDHDVAGRLKRVTDPGGNTIDYGYDMAGHRTRTVDRDAGTWIYGYDLVGNQTSVRDARNVTTFTTFDALNRPSVRHSGDPSKPLATWTYDKAGETGLLDSATRWLRVPGEPVRAYVTDVLGYDDRARPTGRSWVFFDVDLPGIVPSSPDGSPFPVQYGYDLADHQTVVVYPQVGDPGSGGLPAEFVITAYNNLGLPAGMDGTALPSDQDYVYATGYDDRARPLLFGYGKEGSGVGKMWLYNDDQRLSKQQAAAAGALLQDRDFNYEAAPAGKITGRRNTINGRAWMDCYGYDTRNRLTRAYSTGFADNCAPAAAGGGDGPYNLTYSYSDDGNITQRVEADNVITYTYPATGATSVRPHAPTRLDFPGGGDDMDYTWDANGHMLTRTRGGSTETFTWDPERRLDSIETRNATGSSTSSFLYDTEGNRLLRRDVDRTTAYFEGHEVSVSKSTSGSHVTSARTYSLDGIPIATRSASGGDDPTKDKVEYLITDNQGSVELTARNSESAPVVDRTYNPYGAKRTGNDALTDRGWIGEIEDHRSELNYLNARYYDPNLHRFISPDPLYDQAVPQTVNPYAYGLNNPVAFGDPSGLIPLECTDVKFSCRHTDSGGWTLRERPRPPRTGAGGSDLVDEDMSGGNSAALVDTMIANGLIPRSWRSMVADEDDELWMEQCIRRIHDPSCTLSGDFLPQVMARFTGRGHYSGARPAGAWAIPFARQGAVVLQREYRYKVEELRFLGTRVTDDGRVLLTFDSITREYRQEEYAQVGLIGPDETGISGIDVNDDGDLGLEWSGRTAPSVVPNSPVSNWTTVVEIRPDGSLTEW